MSTNSDINLASDRLGAAITVLEDRMRLLISRIERLEADKLNASESLSEAQAFKADRAELARQLDESAAEVQGLKQKETDFVAREAEFKTLARETAQELDRVIGQVRKAMDVAQNGGG